MTISQMLVIVCATFSVTLPLAIAWGLSQIAKALSQKPTPPAPFGMPDLPPPSKEDVESLVERFKEIRTRREEAYGLRGGMPDASNMRPGRHVNVPE